MYVDLHRKCLARQLVAVAMLHASPVPCLFCGHHADHNCHNEHTCSVAGVAHVEEELAADWCDLQDGVDDDDDEDDAVVPCM